MAIASRLAYLQRSQANLLFPWAGLAIRCAGGITPGQNTKSLSREQLGAEGRINGCLDAFAVQRNLSFAAFEDIPHGG